MSGNQVVEVGVAPFNITLSNAQEYFVVPIPETLISVGLKVFFLRWPILATGHPTSSIELQLPPEHFELLISRDHQTSRNSNITIKHNLLQSAGEGRIAFA